MFVVWSGLGLLTVIIVIVGAFSGGMHFDSISLDPGTGMTFGLALAAVANWFIGIKFYNPNNDRKLIDTQSGQSVVLCRRYSIFLIR